jgi:endonuclease/exonuclease/phosphatase family metal-dependent hydrolase
VEQKKRSSFLKRLMFILNILAVIFLLFSYGASFISPERIWWLALFGIGYGIIFAVNIGFVIFWMLLKSRRFLFSLIFILIGLGKVFNIFEFHFSHQETFQKKEVKSFPVKIMSYNVRLFDLYNWFHNQETRGKIFNFLSVESPDIVCFQEYFTSEKKEDQFSNNDTLEKVIPASYSNIAYSTTINQLSHWGIATFSKYPIIHKETVHFQDRGGNIFTFSDIKIGADTIRVYNAHLESIRFGKDDYKFIQNLGETEQDEFKGGMSIILRLKRAFIKRAMQVKVLHRHIRQSPYPVVLCGDFNDTPSSYTYSVLCRGMEDSFRESGSGFGKTYIGAFPSFRIDYILHDEKLKSTGYQTHHQKLSDHFPISCWIEKK